MFTNEEKENLRKLIYSVLEQHIPKVSGYELSIDLTEKIDMHFYENKPELTEIPASEVRNPINREDAIKLLWEYLEKSGGFYRDTHKPIVPSLVDALIEAGYLTNPEGKTNVLTDKEALQLFENGSMLVRDYKGHEQMLMNEGTFVEILNRINLKTKSNE